MATPTPKRISELTPATQVLSGNIFDFVQSGTNKRIEFSLLARDINNERIITPVSITATAYTLSTLDYNKVLRYIGSNPTTFTLPDNGTTPIQVGRMFEIRQIGAGQVTISPALDVTLNYQTGKVAKSLAAGTTLFLHKVGTDEWDLMGDLASV